MVASNFDEMIRNNPSPSVEVKERINSLAAQHGYRIDWEKGYATSAEVRCGWRESMQKDREAVQRARRRGCF
jgi:hypothetical protein